MFSAMAYILRSQHLEQMVFFKWVILGIRGKCLILCKI